MGDRILILTHRHDTYTVDLVAEHLLSLGASPLRVDTDRLPLELTLSLEVGGEASLRSADWAFGPRDVKAVWMRHLGMPSAEGLDPRFRGACESESHRTLVAFLDLLHAARWMDRPRAVVAAEDKLRQYALGQRLGLQVPRTLASNDPEAVRAFYATLQDHPGQPRMIMKMQTPLSTGMEGSAFFLYTTPVGPEALEQLDSLRNCPLLFQQYVPKDRELRVAFVDGRCFAGAVNPNLSQRGRIDWRLAEPGSVDWEPAELPEAVQAPLRDLMKALDLRFGAADFILTPEGDYVFLEVNPCGEWGMLEKALGLPISRAIAEALLEQP